MISFEKYLELQEADSSDYSTTAGGPGPLTTMDIEPGSFAAKPRASTGYRLPRERAAEEDERGNLKMLREDLRNAKDTLQKGLTEFSRAFSREKAEALEYLAKSYFPISHDNQNFRQVVQYARQAVNAADSASDLLGKAHIISQGLPATFAQGTPFVR